MKTKKPQKLIIILAVLAGAISILGISLLALNQDSTETPAPTSSTPETSTQAPPVAQEAVDPTKEQLLYLIEEEKLAHDAYTVMFQKYGAKVFGSILESERTHQARVLTLMQARNITDPRSNEIGVFQNTELQNLYNSLIAQGNQNETEAYKVGVAIEEKDIQDITTQLATATDEDVISTLQALRNASENHLRAFNRQL